MQALRGFSILRISTIKFQYKYRAEGISRSFFAKNFIKIFSSISFWVPMVYVELGYLAQLVCKHFDLRTEIRQL